MAREISFIVYGEPVAKGRPKFRNTGKFIQAYTPKKTVSYEEQVREAFLMTNQEPFMNPDEPLSMNIVLYLTIPSSVSKKKRQLMIDGDTLPTKKPDIDNVLKAISDALNSVAFNDDKNICSVFISKYYSEVPRAEIVIKSLN